MDSQFAKVLDIVKKTGDKVVVFDHGHEFVVSSLDQYSRLIEGGGRFTDLNESDMLDKINRDIAAWRASQEKPQEKMNDFDAFEQSESAMPSYQSLDNLPAGSSADEADETGAAAQDNVVVQDEIDTLSDDIDWDDSFDFEELPATQERSQQAREDKFTAKDILKSESRKNNFGYLNPDDITDDVNNDFEDIPPPPDFDKNS